MTSSFPPRLLVLALAIVGCVEKGDTNLSSGAGGNAGAGGTAGSGDGGCALSAGTLCFRHFTTVATPGAPWGLRAADMDGHQPDDIVFATDSTIGVLLDVAGGAPPSSYGVQFGGRLAISDLTADKRSDVISQSSQPPGAQVLTNLGAGQLGKASFVPAGGSACGADAGANAGLSTTLVSDVIVGGLPEIVHAFGCSAVQPSLSIEVLQLGAGLTVVSNVSSILGGGSGKAGKPAIADLDGDGAIDLLVGTDNAWLIAPNDGAGHFGPAASVAVKADQGYHVLAADFDGNGLPDVAVFSGAWLYIDVYLNTGGLVFGSPQSFNLSLLPGEQADSVIATDLDADGDIDMAATSQQGEKVSLLLNDGTGIFAAASLDLAVKTVSIAAANLDADGTPDLVVGTIDSELKVLFTEAPKPTR